MSGFEIAGIILATIPLFIAAAEHYCDGLSAYDRLRNNDRILQDYILDLGIQASLLETILKGFVADIDVDLSVKRALLESPAGD
jgi:hypothetical protein